MYSVQPALIILAERLNWRFIGNAVSNSKRFGAMIVNPMRYRPLIIGGITLSIALAIIFAPQMRFEVDTKRLEAKMPEHHMAATERIHRVIQTANSRAIIVADGYEELIAVDEALQAIGSSDSGSTDSGSGTIRRVSSILDFIPDPTVQHQRLEVIRRLNQRANDLQYFDRDRFERSQRFLDIDVINIADLPDSLRRTYLGQSKPNQADTLPDQTSYLLYVDPAVNMDNADEAARFYADVGLLRIGDQTIRGASESFILVEMLELMKTDALRAILLVALTTSLIIFLFIRNLTGTLIILAPTLIGLLLTLGIMGAFGPALSIMNMVVLPSLIGISVDNSIHIVHRFQSAYPDADIPSIMSTTGQAAVLTTLTTLVGFGGMITASMLGLRSLAQLAIIGFLVGLVVTWLCLPLLLDQLQKRARYSAPKASGTLS